MADKSVLDDPRYRQWQRENMVRVAMGKPPLPYAAPNMNNTLAPDNTGVKSMPDTMEPTDEYQEMLERAREKAALVERQNREQQLEQRGQQLDNDFASQIIEDDGTEDALKKAKQNILRKKAGY